MTLHIDHDMNKLGYEQIKWKNMLKLLPEFSVEFLNSTKGKHCIVENLG